MPRKRSLDDEQIEVHTRLAVDRLAASISRALSAFGKLLDRLHYKVQESGSGAPAKLSVYSPFGILFFICAVLYFSQIDSIFSPTEAIYFFSLIVILGVYIIRRA